MFRKLILCCGILSLCCWSLLFSPIVPAAHAASPTPPCYGSSCYTKDPFTTKCGIATSYNTVWHKAVAIPFNGAPGYTSVGTLWNYYSTWCNANWTEATVTNGAGVAISIDNGPGPEFQCYDGGNNSYNCPGFYYGPFPMWTNMVDGTHVTTSAVWLSTWPCCFAVTVQQ